MANKYSGFTAKLQVTISGSLTDIAGVRDLSGPSLELTPIDVSSRDSAWMEYVAGMRDAGEVVMEVVYDPDSVTHLAGTAGGFVKDLLSGNLTVYKLTFSDATPLTATFTALVSKVLPKMPFNGMQSADVTFKLTSFITWL